MSRFSKAAAEAAGWSFYHDEDEIVLRDGGDNELGISKKVPASIRAEKMIDLPGSDLFRTTEEAPTLGLLLERINSFEQHLAFRLPASEPDARVPDDPAAPARPSHPEELENLTVAQLKEVASEQGIEVKGKKAKIVAALKGAIS